MRDFSVRPDQHRGGRYTVRALIVALVVLASSVFGAGLALAAPGGNGGGGGGGGGSTAATFVDFAQCKNQAAPIVNLGCIEWINGILNASNSHYVEDEAVPQRLEAELPAGGALTSRTFTLEYQTRKGGIHAYDSLATWNLSQTAALRCLGLALADCVGGSPSTFPIPDDPTAVLPATNGGTVTSGHMIPAGAGRVMTMYGGTITGVSVPVHTNPGVATGDDWATVTITYSVASLPAKVQLLFGGHLAPTGGARGWGAGLGSGNISGGPYHIKWTQADGESIGERDNQIQGAAVVIPPPVPNSPPTVSCPTMSADGLTVTYTASASDSDGTITNYHWVFGDGATADTATNSTTHTYAAGGTYDVTVTVTDDDGDTASSGTPCSVTVTPPPVPNSPPTVSCPTMSADGLTVTYTAAASDSDGTITNYHWVFGDGATADTATNSTTHTYALAGAYDVTVTVTDDDGDTGSSSGLCAVNVFAPPVDGNVPPVVACPTMSGDELVATFAATGIDSDGTITNYHWDFGDGVTLDTPIGAATHTYAADGTYDVTVTVTDDDGATASSGGDCSITVAAGQTPQGPPPVDDDDDETVVLPTRRTLPRTGTQTTTVAWIAIALLFGGMLLRGTKPRPVRMVFAGQGMVARQVAQYGLALVATARPLRLHALRRM